MPQEDTAPAEYQYSKKQIMWGMTAIFSVYATVAFIMHIMGIAKPKIAADLDGLSLYAWSVSIPSLVMAIGTVIFSKFSDMYGRRIMLIISLLATLAGTVVGGLSPNFIIMIIATTIGALGTGAMMPLVFAVIGDLFPPAKRGKWIGLMNVPQGFFVLIGPTLGGFIVDALNWRYLYWVTIPLIVFCLVTVPVGVPLLKRIEGRKIDIMGCIWVIIASSATIIGFSFAGTKYPWFSAPITGLLAISVISWIIFFKVETRAAEPVLDPLVLGNRSFATLALATFFSSFGSMGIMMYFPMFLQGVQGISTMNSGIVSTPYGVLTAFMGVPAGFLISKYSRFKWMYVTGYGLLFLSMFALVFFTAKTSISWSVAVAVVGGLGYGVIPTVNTIVVQNAVPQRLMGAAMGAIFFFLSIGSAIAPAILGSTMNVSYTKNLSESLPEEIREQAGEKIMMLLDDPQILLSEPALNNLKNSFIEQGKNGEELFEKTVYSIRYSLEKSLSNIFLIGASMALLAFFIICTVPGKFNGPDDKQVPR